MRNAFEATRTRRRAVIVMVESAGVVPTRDWSISYYASPE
jgi:hypothetical protein